MTQTESRRATAEERDAFSALVVEHSPALLGYIARRVRAIESAPEVLNDTLLVAWQKRQRMPVDPERARMWLFVAARHCLANYERSANRRRVHETPLDPVRDTIAVNNDPESGDVRAAVLALPAKYRELVTLIHWDGFTITAAATLLGIGASTARTRYARARERLRAQLLPE